mmetsp:Transcript_20128/g.36386  ORF Transcript_20128/g.36386 Transcript_20128/m.36386 type:complete len:313 (+) Transcript_20128:386-1324(+)
MNKIRPSDSPPRGRLPRNEPPRPRLRSISIWRILRGIAIGGGASLAFLAMMMVVVVGKSRRVVIPPARSRKRKLMALHRPVPRPVLTEAYHRLPSIPPLSLLPVQRPAQRRATLLVLMDQCPAIVAVGWSSIVRRIILRIIISSSSSNMKAIMAIIIWKLHPIRMKPTMLPLPLIIMVGVRQCILPMILAIPPTMTPEQTPEVSIPEHPIPASPTLAIPPRPTRTPVSPIHAATLPTILAATLLLRITIHTTKNGIDWRRDIPKVPNAVLRGITTITMRHTITLRGNCSRGNCSRGIIASLAVVGGASMGGR